MYNIREQEVVNLLGADPQIQRHILSSANQFPKEVREVLAALSTVLDYRREHPKPSNVPFGTRRPREELPIFYLGEAYIRQYVCVGIHEDGWAVVFQTALSAVLTRYRVERFLSLVADWETTTIPWLAYAIDVDIRQPLKLAGANGAQNYDLYPHFLERAYGTAP